MMQNRITFILIFCHVTVSVLALTTHINSRFPPSYNPFIEACAEKIFNDLVRNNFHELFNRKGICSSYDKERYSYNAIGSMPKKRRQMIFSFFPQYYTFSGKQKMSLRSALDRHFRPSCLTYRHNENLRKYIPSFKKFGGIGDDINSHYSKQITFKRPDWTLPGAPKPHPDMTKEEVLLVAKMAQEYESAYSEAAADRKREKEYQSLYDLEIFHELLMKYWELWYPGQEFGVLTNEQKASIKEFNPYNEWLDEVLFG